MIDKLVWLDCVRGKLSREDYIDLFWKKVSKEGPLHTQLGKCWLWVGSFNAAGYGTMPRRMINNILQKSYDAHRFSWMLHNKFIENRHTFVCHKCDVKACINPDHLELGTNSKNMLDAQDRGLKRVGSLLSFAKLTKEQVISIRELNNSGLTEEKLAQDFNVSRSTIHRAISNIAYKDIEPNINYIKGKKNRGSFFKLSKEDVLKIRATGRELSNVKLAKKYGVGMTTIHMIRSGETWKHIL